MKLEGLKWVSTAVLVFGAFVNALGIYPLGVIVLIAGSALWSITAFLMKDKALFANNAILLFIQVIGIAVGVINS